MRSISLPDGAFGININLMSELAVFYELYKYDWKIRHDITVSDERELIKKWIDARGQSHIAWMTGWHDRAILEFGYDNKGCHNSYLEFCTNELLDREYMCRLIGDDNRLLDMYNDVYASICE